MLNVNPIFENKNLANTYLATYDVNPSNSAAQNAAGLQNAIDRTPDGGFLEIPPHDGICVIDTTGGLSACPNINKSITLINNAKLKANYSAVELDPAYILKVTAPNVKILGVGEFIGDGNILDGNDPEPDMVFPGLIFVDQTAEGFYYSGPIINTPPKVGIFLKLCNNFIIDDITGVGGPLVYTVGNTGYFGIRIEGGSNQIVNNLKLPDGLGNGGKFITGVFSGGLYGSPDNLVIKNSVADVYEKLAYCYGDNITVDNAIIKNAEVTDVIRIIGENPVVTNINGKDVFAGINVENCSRAYINNVVLTGVKQTGIYVGKASGAYGGPNDNIFISNFDISGDNVDTYEAVFIELSNDSDNIFISNGKVTGMAANVARPVIRLTTPLDFACRNLKINNVDLGDSSNDGISIERCLNHTITNITGSTITGYLFKELGSDYGRYSDNNAKSCVAGINGKGSNTKGFNNCYSEAGNSTRVTLGTGAVVTNVAALNVAPEATFIITPASFQACLTVVANGNLYASIGSGGLGPDFDLQYATGNLAGADHTYDIIVVQ